MTIASSRRTTQRVSHLRVVGLLLCLLRRPPRSRSCSAVRATLFLRHRGPACSSALLGEGSTCHARELGHPRLAADRATAEPAERGLCTIDPIVVHDVRHVAHDLRRVGSSSCLRPSSGACNHVSADHEASRLTKMDDEILQPRSVAAAKFPKGIRCRAWRRVVDSPALAFGVPIAAVPNGQVFPRDVWQRRSQAHLPALEHRSR